MKKSLSRELVQILLSALVVGFIYNAYQPKGLPLLRVEPKKVAASDSVLFSSPSASSSPKSGADAEHVNHVNVIAPLHERALKNPDSMKALVAAQKQQVFTIITLDQFKRLLSAHRGILMDARNADEYAKGHIDGARSVPALEVDQRFEELVQIPRDTLIIIYCNNPDCHLGRSLAEFMNVMEFKRMVLYDDGWDGWIKAGMPIDTSAVPTK